MRGLNRNAAETPRYSRKYKTSIKKQTAVKYPHSPLVFNPYNKKDLGVLREHTSLFHHGGECNANTKR
jgi:hypothetical protein